MKIRELIDREIWMLNESNFDIKEFEKINSFIARKRYADEYLRKIGAGSSRIVYETPDGKVLKLAKNPKGIAQNEYECGLGNDYYAADYITEIFDCDPNNLWILSEKAKKLTPTRFKQLTGVPIDGLNTFLHNMYAKNNPSKRMHVFGGVDNNFYLENEFAKGIIEFMLTYDMPAGDLGRLSSYGEVIRDGQPDVVLVDYGLSQDVYSSYYESYDKLNLKEYFGDDLEDAAEPENIRDGGYAGFALEPDSVSTGGLNEMTIDFKNVSNTIKRKALNYILNYTFSKINDFRNKSELDQLLKNYLISIQNLEDMLKLAKDDIKFFNKLLNIQKILKDKHVIDEDLIYYDVDDVFPENDDLILGETINDISQKQAQHIADFAAKKLNLSFPKLIGNGYFGYAFDCGDTVLKVTTDHTEAVESLKVKQKQPFKRIAEIYGVYETDQKDNTGKIIHVIHIEKLDTYANNLKNVFRKLSDLIVKNIDLRLSHLIRLYRYQYNDYKDEYENQLNELLSNYPEEFEMYNALLEIANELTSIGVESDDFTNENNLGYKKNGLLAFFDIGFGDGYSKPSDFGVSKLHMNEDGTSLYSDSQGTVDPINLQELLVNDTVISPFKISDYNLILNGNVVGKVFLSKRNYDNRTYYDLSEIKIHKDYRGQKIFSRFIQALFRQADQENSIISLTPEKMGDEKTPSTAKLKEIYMKLGFVENKGQNKDLKTQNTLIRFPKNIKQVNEERLDETINQIDDILEKKNINIDDFAEKIVEKIGFNVSNIKRLGDGTQGYAFKLSDDVAMKITTDHTEANEATALLNKKNEHLGDFYKVFRLKEPYEFIFIIIRELLDVNPQKLIALRHQSINEIRPYNDNEEYFSGDDLTEIMQMGWNNAEQFIKNTEELINREGKEKFPATINFLGLAKDLVRYKIYSIDTHGENIGFKKNGNIAYYDIGYSDKKKYGQYNQLQIEEKKINEYVSDINPLLTSKNITIEQLGLKLAEKLNLKVDSDFKLLGKGSQGYAFKINDDIALKITTDLTEVNEAKALLGKKNKYLGDFYDVYRLKKPYNNIFIIVREYLDVDNIRYIQLRNESNQEMSKFKNNSEYYVNAGGLNTQIKYDWNVKNKLIENTNNLIRKNGKENFPATIQFLGLFIELYNNRIVSPDIGENNVGFKKNGNLAYYDIGYTQNSSEEGRYKELSLEQKNIEESLVAPTHDHFKNKSYNEINDVVNIIKELKKKDDNNTYLTHEDVDDLYYCFLVFHYNRGNVIEQIGYVQYGDYFNFMRKILIKYNFINENKSINERITTWMPKAKSVTVKKNCQLGGKGDGTSDACNQGDINNLEINDINDDNKHRREANTANVAEEKEKDRYYFDKVNINESNINDAEYRRKYLKWKKENVSYRGIRDIYGSEEEGNGGMAMLGQGLYSVPASNKKLARGYGKLYVLVNAIPKNPKIVNTLNDWEIWFQQNVNLPISRKLGKDYPDARDVESIKDEMMKLGYDGVIIKGREMVNYTPKDVRYFENDRQLEMYYDNMVEMGYIKEDESYKKTNTILGDIYTRKDLIEKTKEEKKDDGKVSFGCLMAYFDIPNWDSILNTINDDELYDDGSGTFGKENEPHITVLYGFHDEVIAEDFIEILEEHGTQFRLKSKGISIFENENFDVVKFDIEPTEEILKLRQDVETLPNTLTYKDYHPHMTIAYVKKGEGKKYIKDFGKKYVIFETDKLVFSDKNRNKKEFLSEEIIKEDMVQEANIMSLNDLPFKDTIEQMGGHIYSVGGSVRDKFLGKESKDLDILITGIPMDKLEHVLSNFGKVDAVGKSFGILKFKPKGSTEDIDVAIPRTENATGEGGHKGFDVKSDHNLSIEDDLSRRDFTMNAIAKDINGNLIDPFSGIDDIKNKIIRAVNPKAFSDDPLRMIRCCQFAARFGFTIEDQTKQMIRKNAVRIKEIAGERILEELRKVVDKGGDPLYAADLLRETGLYENIFGSKSPAGMESHFDHEGWNNIRTLGEFVFMLLFPIGNESEIFKTRLKGDINTMNEIGALSKAWRLIVKDKFTARGVAHNMYMLYPNSLDSNLLPPLIKQAANELKEGEYPKGLKDLAVNGNDLISLGYKGRMIGDLLTSFLIEIYADKLNNNKEEILSSINNA